MKHGTLFIFVIMAALAILGLSGCPDSANGNGDGGNGDGSTGCTNHSECGNPDLCCENGNCIACASIECTGDDYCGSDEDCTGVCMECDRRTHCCVSIACSSDADCPPEGGFNRFCPQEPDPDLGCRVCEYVRCDADADCNDPSHPLYIASCAKDLMEKACS